MSFKPLLTGGVIVEVDRGVYEELIRNSEKIAAVERLVAANGYVSTNDIIALLGIVKEEKKETEIEE